ncbi:MAG: N-acetyltransferase [Mariprofundales bacterium]
MPTLVSLRPARVNDIDAISSLLQPAVAAEIILPRNRDALFEHLPELLVIARKQMIVGTAALHVYSAKLAEIRSLVVAPDMRGLGLGRLLVEGCEEMARKLGIHELFALTYVTGFFASIGFETIARESLPHKVWTVCIHCHNFSSCKETAVLKKLNV